MIVVFIHGQVAAGKKTVGERLSSLTGLPLFHNHLTVDLARSLFELFSEPFVRLRSTIWRASFAEAARAGQSFIFTFAPEASVDPALIGELCAVIEAAGGRVHFVQLRCQRSIVLDRLANPDRSTKLNDATEFVQIEKSGGFDFPPMPAATVTIDTGAVSPDEAAAAIVEAVPELRRRSEQ